MSLLILVNPFSGDGSGPQFVQSHVIPLLDKAGITFELHETKSRDEARLLARAYIKKEVDASSTPAIVLLGGDGTYHDLINGLTDAPIEQLGDDLPSLELVLLPGGTANALYSSFYPNLESKGDRLLVADLKQNTAHKLQSLLAYIDRRRDTLRNLTIARTTIYKQSSTKESETIQSILAIVVASTALHAAILDTAEKYRSTIPGIERFKVAARDNITNWADAHVELLSRPSQSINIYDPASDSFLPSSAHRLEGPFFYSLSTVNVDRLEPAFVTTPLIRRIPPTLNISAETSTAAIDLILVRPTRNSQFQNGLNDEQVRGEFIQRAIEWFGGAYDNGKHISMRFPSSEDGTESGDYITEYFRVGGWRWIPNPGPDQFPRLVCVDRTILSVPEGGYMETMLLDGAEKRIQVWV